MSSLQIAIGIVSLITAAITIATFFWKATNAISNLRTANASIGWRLDALELTINGVRERGEHLSTRLQGQVEKNAAVIEDLQAYLQKSTSYERRGNR